MSISADPSEYGLFQKAILRSTGIDLRAYKEQQMKRRLTAFLGRHGLTDFSALANRVSTDEGFKREFLDYLTINVSEFFRNPEKFVELATEILPALYADGHSLKIWSAGCSYGAEAYSLAILLNEASPPGGGRITATDIDRTILARAEAGVFQETDLKNVSEERRRRFFVPEGEQYQAKSLLKNLIEVRYHDLLRDSYPSGFDLILCRNVIIYFTDEAKNHIFQNFASALRPGGVLFLGGTESFFTAREFGFEPIKPFFYRKR